MVIWKLGRHLKRLIIDKVTDRRTNLHISGRAGDTGKSTIGKAITSFLRIDKCWKHLIRTISNTRFGFNGSSTNHTYKMALVSGFFTHTNTVKFWESNSSNSPPGHYFNHSFYKILWSKIFKIVN